MPSSTQIAIDSGLIPARPPSVETELLTAFLAAHPSVNFFRFQWLDWSGILRARIATKTHCLRLSATGGHIGVGPAALWDTYVEDAAAGANPGLSTLYPDWASLKACRYSERHASVMCFVHEGVQNLEFKRCPRAILAKNVAEAKKHGVRFLVGFEVETIWLDTAKSAPVPIDNVGAWSSVVGLRNRCLPVLEEIVLSLEESGIPVQQIHTEAAKGHFEISTGPFEPMEAVDSLIYTHETMKWVCLKYDIRPTLFPKPSDEDKDFVGQNMHFSIKPTAQENSFLAGVLQQIPAMCAFSMPLYDSWVRLRDSKGVSSTGTWVGWGTQFRDIPIRKIQTAHWELRTLDATANMYLVIAAFIAAGLDGLASVRQLKCQDVQSSPSKMTILERESLGIVTPLPRSLVEAVSELDTSDVLRRALGGDFIDAYKALKVKESSSHSQLTEAERRSTMLQFF